MKNILFALEGVDGAGKTSMAKDLQNELLKKYKDVKVKIISLPNSSSFGYKKIREVLKDPYKYPPDVLQSLYIANMIECAEKIINPFFDESKENHIGIMDRSLISTIIYNSVSGGNIFNSIMKYTYQVANSIVKGSIGQSEVDFDIINKVYGHLIHPINAVFFLMPPLKILTDHAKNKTSLEENDHVDTVIRNAKAYETFYKFLTGKLNRNIIEYAENSAGILMPDKRKFTKFIALNSWNWSKTEEENYANFRGNVLAKLNL